MPSAAQRNAAKAKLKKEKDEKKNKPGRPPASKKRQMELFTNATDLLIEGMYEKYNEMYLEVGPFEWDLKFPIIQTAGAPWTKEKVKCGMVLMELAGKAKNCLNDAIAAYLLAKNGAEAEIWRSALNRHIRASKNSHDELLPCTCNFLELISDYSIKGDQKGVSYLHILKEGCQRGVGGDLWYFFINYKTLFAAFLYISMTSQFKSVYSQILDLLKDVPPSLEKAKIIEPVDDLPLVERMEKLFADFDKEEN